MSFLLAVLSSTSFNCFKVLNLFIALLLSSFSTDSMGQEEPGKMTKCQIAIAQIYKGLQAVKGRIWYHCGKTMKRSHKTRPKRSTLVKTSAKDIESNNYAMTDVRRDGGNSCFDTDYSNTEDSSSITGKYGGFLMDHSICVPIEVPETCTDEGDDKHSACPETDCGKQVSDH